MSLVLLQMQPLTLPWCALGAFPPRMTGEIVGTVYVVTIVRGGAILLLIAGFQGQ